MKHTCSYPDCNEPSISACDMLFTRIARCNREIAEAITESQKQHSQAGHVGILLWQMDWEREKAHLLDELVLVRKAA